jgi:hypothetical protein
MIDKERQKGRVHSRPFCFIWVHAGSQDRNSQLVLTRNRKPRVSLERHTPDLQPDVRWLSPGLARLRGTTLGALDSGFLFPNTRPGFSAQDNFDAVLYVGPEGSLTSSRLTRAQCVDSEYIAMRRARLALWTRSSEALQDLVDKCAAALGSERTVQ